MSLETLTESDLTTNRPDLVEKLNKAAVEKFRLQENETDAVKTAEAARVAAEKERDVARAEAHEVKLRVAVSEAVADPQYAIPEAARTDAGQRIIERLKPQSITPDKFKETVAEAVKAEGAYIGKVAAKPKPALPANRDKVDNGTEPESTSLEKLTQELIG